MAAFTVPVIGDAHFRQDARQIDRLASVDQIINESQRRGGIGAWAIPGDLYDAGSDVSSRNAWAARIRVMAEIAPVIICYGNHDRDGDLYVLSQLKGAYPVYVVDRPDVIQVRTAAASVMLTVFVMPYPHPSGFVAAGTPPDEVIPTARAALNVIFMEASARLFKAREEGSPTLFLGHANVGGSRLSSGQPLIGHEIELDAELLLRLGDCPKILNHIHFPQEIGGAVLVGSITSMSWGETEAKRYVRVEYHHAGNWEWFISTIPLVTPQLVHVNATFREQDFGYDVAPADVAPGSDVRVRVRFPETERQFFEFGKVRIVDAFAHARRLQIEPICETDRGLRSPEVALAKTLPEKIRAWCTVNDEPVPDHLEAAVADLETKPGDAVVAEFRAKMNGLIT